MAIDEDVQWFEWASESELVIESGLDNLALDLEGLGLHSLLEPVIIGNEDVLLHGSCLWLVVVITAIEQM